MFEFANQWLLLLLDASVKCLLLAGLAAATLKVLRIRDPSLCHRVWSGVLIGMLLLPVLAVSLPTIPLTVPAVLSRTAALAPESTVASADRDTTDVEIAHLTAGQEPDSTEASPVASRVPATAPDESATVAAGQPGAAPPAEHPAAAPSKAAGILHVVPIALLVVWTAVSLALILRFLIGLLTATRLVRRAEVVGPEIQKSLPGARLLSASAAIRECCEINVPVTVGCFRPAVLLPPEWRTWTTEKLNAVIAHEVTHVARRDFLVAFAAELNRCLYWFHPTSWWLRRQLSDLAEEACDDAAIGQTGDRTAYARNLLEIAAQLQDGGGRRVQPGLSMARKSNVESRIATILNPQRPLSERISWNAAALIVVITIPVVGTAAAVRAVSPADDASAPAANDVATTEGGDDRNMQVRGRVTDLRGNAVPDSTVRLYGVFSPPYYASVSPSREACRFDVDDQGRFDETIVRDELLRPSNSRDPKVFSTNLGPWTTMMVSAPGYAPTFISGSAKTLEFDGKRRKVPSFLDEPLTVKLQKPVPVRGRLLTLDGQPVAGATVSVYQIIHHDPARIDEWLSQVSKMPQDPDRVREASMLGLPVQGDAYFPRFESCEVPTGAIEPVETDSQGWFGFDHLLAANDVAVLRIRRTGIADRVIHVMARDMQPVYGPQATRFTMRGAYYGQTFDFVTEPSVPVFGIVRDIETGEPLGDVPVAVSGIYGTTMNHAGFIATRTDEQGRYRIEGLPIAPKGTRRYDGNELSVRPGNLPYIESDHFQVPVGDGVNPIEFNVELRRAVMVRGRLTEKETGKPVVAEIYYAPFETNENCDKFSPYSTAITTVAADSSRYHSDKNGNFRIPVIPGRGIVAVIVRNAPYVTGYGANAIEEFKDEAKRRGGHVTRYAHVPPSMYHSLKEIDVPADARTFDVTMEVDRGFSMTVQFVGPDGQPVDGVRARGLTSGRAWKQDLSSETSVTALEVDTVRPIYATNQDQTLARFTRLIAEEGLSELRIQLLPRSQLTGRLVDTEGQPVAGVMLDTRHQNDPDFMSSLERVTTDESGRFRIELPVGVAYSVVAQSQKPLRVVENLENDEPRRIDLGDLVVDDNAKRWSNMKALREPVITSLKPD